MMMKVYELPSTFKFLCEFYKTAIKPIKNKVQDTMKILT